MWEIVSQGLDNLETSLHSETQKFEQILLQAPELGQSSLLQRDWFWAVMAGVVGGTITSSEKIQQWLDSIHTDASLEQPRSLLGTVFHHKGDNMDQFPTGPDGRKFVRRDYFETGETSGAPQLHRLFFGHDPFSLCPDNPFLLLIKQRGLLRGPLQVVRHLAADTFSKQGLPMPSHSWFDYSTHRHNRFADLANEAARNAHGITGGSLHPNQVFGHLFSVRMQDILAQGLTWGICGAYCRVAKVNDPIRRSQIKLVAYTVAVIASCLAGYLRYGVPFLNWPSLLAAVKEFVTFLRLNYADIAALEARTSQLVADCDEIMSRVFANGKNLPSYATAAGYDDELGRQLQDYADFLEEMEGGGECQFPS